MMLCDVYICLSVAYIGPIENTQRPGRLKLAHVSRMRLSMSKGQGHPEAALLTVTLTHQPVAAVTVGTF